MTDEYKQGEKIRDVANPDEDSARDADSAATCSQCGSTLGSCDTPEEAAGCPLTSDARAVFALLGKHDLSTVHHALRILAKFPTEKDEATRLADDAWAVVCERAGARHA